MDITLLLKLFHILGMKPQTDAQWLVMKEALKSFEEKEPHSSLRDFFVIDGYQTQLENLKHLMAAHESLKLVRGLFRTVIAYGAAQEKGASATEFTSVVTESGEFDILARAREHCSDMRISLRFVVGRSAGLTDIGSSTEELTNWLKEIIRFAGELRRNKVDSLEDEVLGLGRECGIGLVQFLKVEETPVISPGDLPAAVHLAQKQALDEQLLSTM